MPLPQFDVESNSGGPPLPLEGMPAFDGKAAAFKEGAASSLLASGLTRVKGLTGDQTFVSYDDAAKEMKTNGYDPSVLPSGGLSRGYLDALQDQQSAIRRNSAEADDAGVRHTTGIMPSWRGISEFAGGSIADSPFFLLGGGAAGLGLRAAGLAGAEGLTGFGIRALEGEAIAGGYDVGRREAGTAPGDKDLGMYDFARDLALGGVLGGAIGPRGHVTTADIRTLERTDAYAKTHGLNPNEVVSSAGAIGEHQIMPETARALGFDPAKLTDPRVNAAASQKLLDQLSARYPNDPEAVAIAYNAGPRRANKWLQAGRDDSVLPKETQGYVARYREIVGGALADHNRIQSAAADAMQDHVPVSNDSSAPTKPIWDTPDADSRLAKIAELPKTLTPETEQLTQQANDAVKDAEHATLMRDPDNDLSGLQNHLRQAQESIQGEADIENAIKAAVQCGIVKGFD